MYIKSAAYLHQKSFNLALNEVFFLMLLFSCLSQIATFEYAAPAAILIDPPLHKIGANKVP